MQLIAYLNFDGKCEEAFEFYARCFDGQVVAKMPFAGTPMEQHAPPEWRGKMMHARMICGTATLMGSDAMPGQYVARKSMSVALQVKEPAEAERIFKALSEDGRVTMPIQKTFWSASFGMVTDRYGIPWIVNCEAPA